VTEAVLCHNAACVVVPFLACCRTEVSPQSSKLSSLDAAAHAAVVRTFLQMAWGLIIMQSGLLQELSQMVSDAFQLLDTCADTARDCLDEAQEPVMDRKDQVGLEGDDTIFTSLCHTVTQLALQRLATVC